MHAQRYRIYSEYGSSDRFWLALIFVFCAAIMAAIPIFGIPEGYDVPQHLRFAATFHDALSSGQLVPGWAGVDNHGFGSIGTRIYPPVADYLLALTQMVTGDWYRSFWIDSFFWMFLGCVGAYLWTKEFAPAWQAAAAAGLYAVIPYRLLEIYQFVLFSEFAASAVLPFCFLGATRVIRRGRMTDVLLLAVSVAVLVLTHIPTTLIGGLTLAVYCAFLIDRRSPWRALRQTATALALSLAATSFYWLRLVTEMAWVKHSTAEYSSGFYDYRRHFFPIYLSYGEWYWQRLFWLLDIGIVLTIVFALPIVWMALARHRSSDSRFDRRLSLALAAGAVFPLFMLSKLSEPLWTYLPALEKIQFAWRFLSAASLVCAISFAVAVPRIAAGFPSLKKGFAYSSIALVLCVVLYDVTQTILPAAPLPPEKFAEKLADMRTEEGCSCWWPVWATDKAFERREPVDAGERAARVVTWDREHRAFIVGAGAPTAARVATFYYPHWQAVVNGHETPVSRDENGAITLELPAEASTVELRIVEPARLYAAQIVSLSAWLMMLFASIAAARGRIRGLVVNSR
ncbi:MAG: 6-pyruvoyl-tetrahydropterin synthase-related protein [Pyrinomonadaceae bacterium]